MALLFALALFAAPSGAAACNVDDVAPSEDLRETAELASLALCAAEHHHLEGALALFRAAHDAAPPGAARVRASLLFNIARLLERLHRDEEAADVYAAAFRLSAGDTALRQLIHGRAALTADRLRISRSLAVEHESGRVALAVAAALAVTAVALAVPAIPTDAWSVPSPMADVLATSAASLLSMAALAAVIGIIRLSIPEPDAARVVSEGVQLRF